MNHALYSEARSIIEARRAQFSNPCALDAYFERLAADCAASQPRADATIDQLPSLGSVASTDELVVFHQGQTYKAPASALPASTGNFNYSSVVFAESFGAVGDGITDDYAAITAALNAIPAHGGFVQLLAKNYAISQPLALVRSYTGIRGAGAGATQLICLNNSNSGITCIGGFQYNFIKDLTITRATNVAPLNSTAPAGILARGSAGTPLAYFLAENVSVYEATSGVYLSFTANSFVRNVKVFRSAYVSGLADAFYGFNINGTFGANSYLDVANCYATTSAPFGTATPLTAPASSPGLSYGFYIAAAAIQDHLYLTDIEADLVTFGINIQGGATDNADLHVRRFICDQFLGEAVLCNATNVNGSITFTDGWCAPAALGVACSGWVFSSARNVSISGVQFNGANAPGFLTALYATHVQDFSVSNCIFRNCWVGLQFANSGGVSVGNSAIGCVFYNTAASTAGDQILLQSAQKTTIMGCQFDGANGSIINAILVDAGNVNTTISGCCFNTAAMGTPVSILAGATFTRIVDCPGVNPGGWATPAVGASPWTYVNNSGFNAMVYITGGTVSNVTVDGTAPGYVATGVSVFVPAGSTMVVTYSVLPTVRVQYL